MLTLLPLDFKIPNTSSPTTIIMTHGHEILHMMEGNTYANKQELVDAIHARFGQDERFYTCSATNMTALEIVEFLSAKGKFMPTSTEGFTVDATKICKH
jgi:probable metal-binding protein